MPFNIQDIDYVLGEVPIDLNQHGDDFDRLVNATGIPVVFKTEGSSLDLAEKSARKVLERNPVNVGALILVTQSPVDFLPAGSCVLHTRLGLPPEVLTFDFNQGCSGFVQSLFVAQHLLHSFENILIVCTDVYRQKLRPGDRSTESVFSDGSAAILISNEPQLEITGANHFTMGDKRDLLYQNVSGEENDGYLHMAGRDIWIFTRKYVVPQIMDTVNLFEPDEIRNIFIHQASKLVVEGIEKEIPVEGVLRKNYSEVGNTVSSSIPILMKDYVSGLSSGVSVLSGFGVGLTSTTLALRPFND